MDDLRPKVAELYGGGEGTVITWRGVFGDELPALLDELRFGAEEAGASLEG